MEKLPEQLEERPELDAIRARLGELPVLPDLVTRLVSLDLGSDAAYDEVVAIAEQDPTFAARVLALANSASMAPRTEIHSISQAVARIGVWKIAELVSSMAVMDVFVPSCDASKALWIHSLETAITARGLARLSAEGRPVARVNPQEAYLLGLLHDIGRMAMLQLGDPTAVELAMTIDEGRGQAPLLVTNERGRLGYDHAEVGGLAATAIGLPERLAGLIRWHHDTSDRTALSERVQDPELLQLVQLADAFSVRGTLDPMAFGLGGEPALAALEACYPSSWAEQPVPVARFAGLVASIAEETRTAIRSLGL